jgi:hypothetical protein
MFTKTLLGDLCANASGLPGFHTMSKKQRKKATLCVFNSKKLLGAKNHLFTLKTVSGIKHALT